MKLKSLLLTVLIGAASAQAKEKPIRWEIFGEEAGKKASPAEIKSYLDSIKVLYAASFFEHYRKNQPSSLTAQMAKDDLFKGAPSTGQITPLDHPERKFQFSIETNDRFDLKFHEKIDLADHQERIDFLISKGLYGVIPNHPCKCDVIDAEKKGTIDCHFKFDLTSKKDIALLDKALYADHEAIVAALLGEKKSAYKR